MTCINNYKQHLKNKKHDSKEVSTLNCNLRPLPYSQILIYHYLTMKFILPYLRPYRKLIFLALILASINQLFSLMDPQIFRMIIDNWITKFDQYETSQFVR